MPKIKTKEYIIDGQVYPVNFNCSKTGVFSANIPFELAKKLSIDNGRRQKNNLSEIENEIDQAWRTYVEATKKLSLGIAVSFGASGKFIRNEDGYVLDGFGSRDKFTIDTFGNGFISLIGFDYRVIIIEEFNGYRHLYQGVKWEGEGIPMSHRKFFGGYVDNHSLHGSINANETLIEFSEEALINLEGIRSQLRKAVVFLHSIISSDDLEKLLHQPSINVLKLN